MSRTLSILLNQDEIVDTTELVRIMEQLGRFFGANGMPEDGLSAPIKDFKGDFVGEVESYSVDVEKEDQAAEAEQLMTDLRAGREQPVRLLLRGGHVIDGVLREVEEMGVTVSATPAIAQMTSLPMAPEGRTQSWTVRLSDVVAAYTTEG